MNIKPNICQDIENDNHHNKDFTNHLVKYTLINMIIFELSAVSCSKS